MIHIITDSTSDFDIKEIEKLNINVVSLSVLFGNASYRDNIDLTKEDFYNKLAITKELPTTSQVNPNEFIEVFQEKLQNKDDEIIGIFISSDLSGTYQSAVIAKEHFPSEKIHLIDSRSVTFGLALLVREAVKMREAKKTAIEIITTLQSLIPKVKIFAIVDTLKYLKMGGRISATTALIGGVLGINPLIAIVDGKVENAGKVRGRKAGFRWIEQQISEEQMDLTYPVAFGHTNDENALNECKDYFTEKYSLQDRLYANIGSVVGTHAGPGAVGIAYIAKA